MYGWAMASGLLMAWSFPRFHWHPLAWLALMPLLARCHATGARETAWQFGTAALVFYLVVLQWLMANIHWAGGWAVLGYGLLCLGLSLFWMAVGGLWAVARRHADWLGGAWFLACLWVGMEWLQGWLFTGFPWATLGYCQGGNLAVAQWSALGGVLLLSFALVWVNGCLAGAWCEKRWRWARLGAVAAVLLAGHGLGAWMMGTPDYTSKPFTAGLYQSNYGQHQKWDDDYAVEMVERACQWSEALAQNEALDCMVWPEALSMRHYEDPAVFEPMSGWCRRTGVPLLAGTVRSQSEPRKEFNSCVLINAQGEAEAAYDKVHLAPFGEFVPFEERWPFLAMLIGFGGVSWGEEQAVFQAGGRTLGPLICFEVLFPELSEALRARGADCLVVMTNLAWFGASNVISQEVEMARLRAIETRLPLVHCANTGVSGVFDPWGRFEPVNATLSGTRYYKASADWADIDFATLSRRIGALRVAAPGARPIPHGPAVFPWLVMGLAAGATAVAAFLHFQRKRTSA